MFRLDDESTRGGVSGQPRRRPQGMVCPSKTDSSFRRPRVATRSRTGHSVNNYKIRVRVRDMKQVNRLAKIVTVRKCTQNRYSMLERLCDLTFPLNLIKGTGLDRVTILEMFCEWMVG